jgi:ribosomal-protein-alanine N-acetyltransferase
MMPPWSERDRGLVNKSDCGGWTMREMPVLRTERLVLRPFAVSDAVDVQRLAGDWAIADTTLNIPHPYEDGMAEQWIATHKPRFEEGKLCNFAVTLRDSGDLVGAIGLVITRRFDHAELGYWIGKPYWGKGFCTEAARAVIDYGFTVLGLQRIHASHLARNPASGRVMRNIGMKQEGTLRGHAKKWDKYEDLVLYGILKQEWQDRSQQT